MQITRIRRGERVGPEQVLEALNQESTEVRTQIVSFYGCQSSLHLVWANVRLSLRLSTQRKIASSTTLLEVSEGDPSHRKRVYREKNRLDIETPLGPLARGTDGSATLRNGKGVHGLGHETGGPTETRASILTTEYTKLRGAVEWLALYSRSLLRHVHELRRESRHHSRVLENMSVVTDPEGPPGEATAFERTLIEEAGELEEALVKLLGGEEIGSKSASVLNGERLEEIIPQTPQPRAGQAGR